MHCTRRTCPTGLHALALLTVLALIACGTGDGSDVESTGSPTGGVSDPETTETQSPEILARVTRACLVPEVPRCAPDGSAVLECSEEGELRVVERCDAGCLSGACLDLCPPGGVRCQGRDVLVCGEREAARSEVEACGDEICVGGACVLPFCTPGRECIREDALLLCDDDGVLELALRCGPEQECFEGRCVATQRNACGGTVPLAGRPGAFCGPCGRDRFECAGPDALVCSGATVNACGGCGALEGEVGEPCGTCGTWACAGADRVRCEDPGQNVCGGCSVLEEGALGEACGPCGEDVWQCESGELVCSGSTDNGCGGCVPLAGPPGTPCGDCGTGQWTCDAPTRSLCVESLSCRPQELAAGSAHTCLRLGDDRVSCWGRNSAGQTGSGTVSETRRTPTLIEGEPPVMSRGLMAGADYTCAAFNRPAGSSQAPGQVRCWGANSRGQLGDGTQRARLLPGTLVTARVLRASAGERHACAIRSGPTLGCWGANGRGQLGDGTREDSLVRRSLEELANVPGGMRDVAAGGQHTCAVSMGGSIWCWGGGDEGQNGDPAGEDRLLPTPFFLSEPAVRVAAGRSHTCALTSAGNVWCWGSNARGELGSEGSSSATALQVPLPGTAVRIAAGGRSTCAVLAEGGELWCWGDNGHGQLGDGTRSSRARPLPVNNLRSVRLVALGEAHACATREDGTLWCWGDNREGQLTGTALLKLTPAHVPRP